MKVYRVRSFAYDLNTKRGIVRSRVILLLRSSEIKPSFYRSVQTILFRIVYYLSIHPFFSPSPFILRSKVHRGALSSSLVFDLLYSWKYIAIYPRNKCIEVNLTFNTYQYQRDPFCTHFYHIYIAFNTLLYVSEEQMYWSQVDSLNTYQ